MDNIQRAKNVAARLVAARMYTCYEVCERLIRKNVDEETAEKVVSEFVQAGLLNDKMFAEAYVEDAVKISGKGLYRIKQELYRKGVAKSIVEEVCKDREDDTFSALSEYVEARKLYEGIETRKDLEKLKAKLVRRGFSISEVNKCLSEYNFVLRREYD